MSGYQSNWRAAFGSCLCLRVVRRRFWWPRCWKNTWHDGTQDGGIPCPQGKPRWGRGGGNLPSELTGEPNFEREQWEADLRLREHEVAVNARKNETKIVELRRSRWSPPIFCAVCRQVRQSNSTSPRTKQTSEHAVERVVLEQVAFLEIGAERRVAGVPAELLQLGRMDPPVFGGIHGAAFEAVA